MATTKKSTNTKVAVKVVKSKSSTPKVAAKPTPSRSAKPAAKSSPVKANAVKKALPVKAAVKKPVAKIVSKGKVQAKAAKPTTAAPKKVATSAKKPPTSKKPVVTASAKKPVQAPVARPSVAKSAPVVKSSKVSKPIVVVAPMNENVKMPIKSPPVMMKRQAEPAKNHVNSAAGFMNRPAYRPIQVINKSLAPIQPVRQMAPAPMSEKVEYKKGDYVVYPAHGVGQIEAIEMQTIAGMDIKLYAIVFEKDRMRLKVPVFKAHASGLRRLSTGTRMQDALKTLQGRAQVRRAMWSRRAQEYETKINSGDPVAIAEVLRDLKRSNDDTEQSYSERQIYQSAMERLAREVAAVERISEIEATERLEKLIRSGRKPKAETAAERPAEAA